MSWKLNAVAMAVGVLGVGCDHDHDHEEEKPGADACEHLEGGPIRAVTAGADAASAVALTDEHTRYDITMAGAGFVSLASAEDAEVYFYFDSPVTLTVRDGSGTVVPAEMQATSDADCALVKAMYVFDLGIGTYTLEVEPAASDTLVQLVFFEAGGHEH